MTAIPGSHYLIEKAIAEPKFRAEKEKDNVYTAGNNLEELDWNPEEIVLKAGGVFFYGGLVIHSASDNMTQQPRLVCLYNFTQKGDREKEVNARQTIHERFNSEHLKMMDDQMKQLVGLV